MRWFRCRFSGRILLSFPAVCTLLCCCIFTAQNTKTIKIPQSFWLINVSQTLLANNTLATAPQAQWRPGVWSGVVHLQLDRTEVLGLGVSSPSVPPAGQTATNKHSTFIPACVLFTRHSSSAALLCANLVYLFSFTSEGWFEILKKLQWNSRTF